MNYYSGGREGTIQRAMEDDGPIILDPHLIQNKLTFLATVVVITR